MTSVDKYDATVTSIEYSWPKGVTPLERIILSAHGDLQRILSAFFARPITISLVFAQTSPSSSPSSSPSRSPRSGGSADPLNPSLDRPTTQKRQVHLLCAGKTVCVATSAVRITTARCARLFLQEGFAIGQIFRRMGVVPAFELLEAGIMSDDALDDEKGKGRDRDRGTGKMWRRYTLKVDGFEADIVEVFPDRAMFTLGEAWLDDTLSLSPSSASLRNPLSLSIDESGMSRGPWSPCLSANSIAFSDREYGPERDFYCDSPALSTPSSVTFDLPEAGHSRESSYLKVPVLGTPTRSRMPPSPSLKESWADSNGGLTRFMLVFLAVLVLLAVPRESGETGWSALNLWGRA